MARYKQTNSITMKKTDYPDAVEAANEIAKLKNRSVHEVVEEVLVSTFNLLETDNQLASAG